MSKQGGFCFVRGELVDCMPGQVQDCNNKQFHKCPLLENQSKKEDVKSKKKKESEPKQQSFCFVKGELVDCMPGRVQDCNNKQLHKCPLLEEETKKDKKTEKKKAKKETPKQQSFCFVKGELVDCMPGMVQDCNNKQFHKCPLMEEASKKDKKIEKKKAKEEKVKEETPKQQSFCFVKGELVDCMPGRVQDCNNKQLRSCPLE